ncbi:MAG TPA: alpha/beta hydrolase [Ohtaekwangia sp.]|nr:alpha/beta hydrolase [Ohtaekwangia sp.]
MSNIVSSAKGAGQPVILLHGFPFNQSLWDPLDSSLAALGYRIYTPDLPGFGTRAILPPAFTLEHVATEMLQWINDEKIERAVLLGHSLGGYVTLEMVRQQPGLFAGFGLLHSTAAADNPEKKESRNKAIEFIRRNGVLAFTTNFIEPLFADPRNEFIPRVKKIASEAKEEAVIGYTTAMRDRNNQESVLKNFTGPVLFVAGEHDKGIPVESVKEQASLCQRSEVHILSSSAHMSMFEQTSDLTTVMAEFISRCQA